jgi:hypothetical protein
MPTLMQSKPAPDVRRPRCSPGPGRVARHPPFGRLCVQAIRDAPIDPPAVERLTMAVRHTSPNFQPVDEARVSRSPERRGESLGVWNSSMASPETGGSENTGQDQRGRHP